RARYFASARSLQRLLEEFQRRRHNSTLRRLARRHISAQLTAALVQIRDLRTIRRRPEEARVARRFLGDRNLEPRTAIGDLRFVQLLLWVRDVAPFARFAQSVAFHGVREDQSRLALGFERQLVGVVDLLGIVPATMQLEHLFVAQVRYEIEQLWILA